MRKPQAGQAPSLVGKMGAACLANEDLKGGRKAFTGKRVPDFKAK